MNKNLYWILTVLVLASCSNELLYEVGQDYQKSECMKEAVSDSQYNYCVNTEKKSFEKYKKDRKEVINN